jgi:SAM-dependent methyltransferase
MPKDAAYLANVRAQYEALPYPPRDSRDERKRLIRTYSDQLALLNHYGFQGRRDFRGFKALVAGSGTGDGTIYLAEQLKGFSGARVVSIDISEASNDVARARARVRGLKNITFLHGSLLELPERGLEPFDYVNCVGVLHHLADPDAGLKALTAVLKPDGLMSLMLYATYGRTGVYQMQELMRLINGDEPDIQAKVDTTKAVLAELPAGNWFKRGEELITDHRTDGDVGIYDVFLHEQDRAYTVPETYDFVERAGLTLVDYSRPPDRMLLDPANCIRDPGLLERVRALPVREQRAVAELVTGLLIKHQVYAARAPDTVASLDDLDNVPFLVGFPPDAHRQLADQMRRAPGAPVEVRTQAFGYRFTPRRYTAAIFANMDGQRSLGRIFEAVRRDTGEAALTDDDLKADFAPVYRTLEFGGHLLLRHRTVAPLKDPAEGPPGRRR